MFSPIKTLTLTAKSACLERVEFLRHAFGSFACGKYRTAASGLQAARLQGIAKGPGGSWIILHQFYILLHRLQLHRDFPGSKQRS